MADSTDSSRPPAAPEPEPGPGPEAGPTAADGGLIALTPLEHRRDRLRKDIHTLGGQALDLDAQNFHASAAAARRLREELRRELAQLDQAGPDRTGVDGVDGRPISEVFTGPLERGERGGEQPG